VIYLDSSATAMQKPKTVPRAVLKAMRSLASPGRGGYRPAMEAAEAVYDCRAAAAELFAAQPEQVVFTMNATHGLNLAIKSLARRGDTVVISGFEHNSVVRPLHHLGANVIVAGEKLFDPENTLAAFDRAVTEDTKAVVCTHVSNVFGYILPVEQIADLCRRRGVPFVLDASQSAGTLPVSLSGLGAAFIAMPGHKGLYGPSGTGLLLCGQKPATLLEGGSGSLSKSPEMPDFLPDLAEAGTQNTAGICGLAAGLRFVQERGMDEILRHEQALRRELAEELARLDGMRIFADDRCQTGVLSFLITGEDCELTAQRLGENGFCVRAGLHCAPLAHKSAGTLETGTVRVSFSAFNTKKETERLIRYLKK